MASMIQICLKWLFGSVLTTGSSVVRYVGYIAHEDFNWQSERNHSQFMTIEICDTCQYYSMCNTSLRQEL